MSATIGTCVFLRISRIAAAASSSGTAIRTISHPASTISSIWRIVASTSVVSVFVIDCTATGAPPPIATLPTITCFVTLFIKTNSERLFRHQARYVEKYHSHHQEKHDRKTRQLYPFLCHHRQCFA